MAKEAEAAFRQRVEALVAQIPPGRAMTYGQIAALCGNARAARIVGGIAHFGNPDLPWQRVVNRYGGLAAGYPGGRSGHKQVLEAEGFTVSAGYRIDIKKHLWRPTTGVPKLVVVVGETASGKTELAIRLAEKFNGEIICADSWTVRREADIGTAKPTAEEQARVPHHLLDVVEPCGDFTAAVFKRLANEAIRDITDRGKLPIMAGGTGLYVDGVIYDFGFLPAGDRGAREDLNKLNNRQLLDKIRELGLELGGVDVRNKRRLIRLLETGGAKPTRKNLRQNTLLVGLRPARDDLKERITRRADAMLATGLEAEVLGLSQRYGWECETLKGISYAEWQDYFLGTQSLAETRQKIIRDTLDLAKRQRTWFKRNKSIHWFSTPVNWHELVELVTTFLSN